MTWGPQLQQPFGYPTKPAGGAPLLGGAAQDTAPNAPTWNPGLSWGGGGTKSGAVDWGGPGNFFTAPTQGEGGQPAPAAPPQGTLQGPGTLEKWQGVHGEEFTAPGPAMDFWNTHGNDFLKPSRADTFFEGVAGSSAPHADNRSAQAYEQYQREMPAMLDAPDLGTYYDQAQARTLRGIGNEQAARGVYGSSVGAGIAGDSIAALNAERANREADYNLQRNADRRASLMGAGQLGRAGDLTDLANGTMDLSWMSELGNLAHGADASNLSGLLGAEGAAGAASDERLRGLSGGAAAAGAAQGAGEGRERGQLNDLLGVFSLLAGIGMGTYGSEISGDQGLMDAGISGGIGGATNAFNMDSLDGQKFLRDLGAFFDMYSGGKAAGMFGGPGPQPTPAPPQLSPTLPTTTRYPY